jgi:predicted outer membrane protein
MKLHLWLAVGAALAVGTCGIGGSVRADGNPIADRDFLAETILHGAYAVRASELALTEAKAQEVQQLARQVIAGRGMFSRALHTLARDHDVPVLFNQSRGWGLAESRLAGFRRDAFDREFLRLLSKDLGEWIDLSQRCATGPGGRAERDLASTMLPVLRQQFREANRLLKTVR